MIDFRAGSLQALRHFLQRDAVLPRNRDGVFAKFQILVQIIRAFLRLVAQRQRLLAVGLRLLLDVSQTRQIFAVDVLQADGMSLLISQQQHQLDTDIPLQLRAVELRIRLDLLADGVLYLLQDDGQIHHLHDIVAAGRVQQVFQVLLVHDLPMAVQIRQQQFALTIDLQFAFLYIVLKLLDFLVAFFTRHRERIRGSDGIAKPPRLQVVLFLCLVRYFLLKVLNLFIVLHARLAGDQLQRGARKALCTTAKPRLVFARKNVFVVGDQFVHAMPHFREFRRLDFRIQNGFRILRGWRDWCRRNGCRRRHPHLLLCNDHGTANGLLDGGASCRQERRDDADIQKHGFMILEKGHG